MHLSVDRHEGMSVLIAPEKLPSYVYQGITNLELSRKVGSLKKRKGYKNILTSGLTTLKSMIEYVNTNGTRILLLQDGTAIERSIYSGGAYGAIGSFSNDERTAASTVDQMYPVKHEGVVRSGAGTNAAANRPFWNGYIKAVSRFPNSGTPVAITAGRYLYDQFHDATLASLIQYNIYSYDTSQVSGVSLDEGRYTVYAVPVIDGHQRGLPYTGSTNTAIPLRLYTGWDVITFSIEITTANQAKFKRITDIDLFLAQFKNQDDLSIERAPAYFLGRLPLDGDGPVITSFRGTFENANPPTYIEIDDNAVDWRTFPLTRFYAVFSHGGTPYAYRLGAETLAGSPLKAQYAITGGAAALQNVTVDFDLTPRWYLDTDYKIQFAYDNHHIKLGSEMFTYLGLPFGDTGRGSDRRYKYGAEANKRYFIAGVPEGRFGYFSNAERYDIIPANNILRFKAEPSGLIGLRHDIFVFFKDSCSRYTVISNQNAEKDEDFSDIGAVSQAALCKVSDDEVYGFDYQGPWAMYGRRQQRIGEQLKTYWLETLSEAQKDNARVFYNRLKDWVIFSFPTFLSGTTSFVYDRQAAKRNDVSAWWILLSDTALYNGCTAYDLHLLTGSLTKIVDWNNTSADETVSSSLQLKVIKNPVLGNKMHVGRLYMDYATDDTVTAEISVDGAAFTAISILGNKQSVIKYMCETLELKLSTAASANDVEFKSMLMMFEPQRK